MTAKFSSINNTEVILQSMEKKKFEKQNVMLRRMKNEKKTIALLISPFAFSFSTKYFTHFLIYFILAEVTHRTENYY